MSKTKPLSKLVRPLPKGQITLPIEFRRRLKIDEQTVLNVSLKGDKIEITPLKPVPAGDLLRDYSNKEIKDFLKEDRLDQKTAEKVLRLLGKDR